MKKIGDLRAGREVTILERNRVGHWLYVESNEDVGWVKTGFLRIDEALQFSEIPINETQHHADLSQIIDESLTDLYTAPIIPEIRPQMCEVLSRGMEAGNHADVISKVGDSNSVARMYLSPLGRNEYDLGPYDFLQATVDYYNESFAIESAAARVGMNAASVFDPFWSSRNVCEDGESPLVCEFRRTQPSVAVIMFGINDTKVLNTESYETQTQRIIEETLEHGIIPMLIFF